MKRKEALYAILSEHAGTYCSGEALAQQLGISRAAVCEKTELENGAVCYDVTTNGLKEKFTFTEI